MLLCIGVTLLVAIGGGYGANNKMTSGNIADPPMLRCGMSAYRYKLDGVNCRSAVLIVDAFATQVSRRDGHATLTVATSGRRLRDARGSWVCERSSGGVIECSQGARSVRVGGRSPG